MSEIAAAAELSLASVYALFDSKDELYHEVVERSGQTMVRFITAKVEAVPDPGERLLALIDAMLDCYEDHRELLQLYVRTSQGLPYRIREGMGEESLERYQAFTHWVIGLVEAAKRAGALGSQDSEILAYALIGTIVTTCAHWVERDDAPPLTDAGPAIRALFRSSLSLGA